MPTPRDIAEAFSSHRFGDALPWLADDVVWTLIGSGVISGSSDVAEACAATTSSLVETSTHVTRFDVIDGGDVVAVDTETTYGDDASGDTSVASCDIYRFRRGQVVEIRSYTVEFDREGDPANP